MTINEHIIEFAGKPVMEWDPEKPAVDLSGKAVRISVTYEQGEEGTEWNDIFASFLKSPASREVDALVVGPWEETWENSADCVIEPLVKASKQLPKLRAIFFGDITMEESEISWIQQGDMTPLFKAYPFLEHFTVRGGEGLVLGSPSLPKLRSLVVQTGGLPDSVVKGLCRADLPQLEHLELWLGTDGYGGTTKAEDLGPILSGKLFPKLRYLGLKNSEIQDEIAQAVAKAPVVEKLEVLDLSMGTLSDQGAEALIASPAVARLKKLDIHHHYVSDKLVAKLEALGIGVDADEHQEEDDYNGEAWRYVEVSE